MRGEKGAKEKVRMSSAGVDGHKVACNIVFKRNSAVGGSGKRSEVVMQLFPPLFMTPFLLHRARRRRKKKEEAA